MAVARQELQDPDPQSLVPHVGAQRFQARGEALVHRRGVCRASIPPLPLPLPPEVVPGQAPRVRPGHIHWRVGPIRHSEVGEAVCLLVPRNALVPWDLDQGVAAAHQLHHLRCNGGGEPVLAQLIGQHSVQVRSNDPTPLLLKVRAPLQGHPLGNRLRLEDRCISPWRQSKKVRRQHPPLSRSPRRMPPLPPPPAWTHPRKCAPRVSSCP
mmetsp:Transcript_18851/g.30448  ORF Transcript_18851/g.30448 Transcript_18851/m.30448 type:complete len:210 (-) Transcript_18851:154-783(-)